MNEFPLKPLGTGELLDRALRIARGRFWELFKVAFAFEAVLHGTAKLFEMLAFRNAPSIMSMSALGQLGVAPPRDQFAWLLGITLASIAISVVAFQAAVGAVSVGAEESGTLASFDASACWRRLRPRLSAMLGTLVVELLLIGAWVSVGLAPAAMGIAGAWTNSSPEALLLLALGAMLSLVLVPAIFLTVVLRYLLVPSVVVLEGKGGLAAIARSVQLMRGSSTDRFMRGPKLRASVVLLVLGLVMNAVILVSDAPRSLMLLANGGHAPNLALMLVAEIVALIAKTTVLPFGALSIALFYLDIRVRREGLDLELTARKLAKAA